MGMNRHSPFFTKLPLLRYTVLFFIGSLAVMLSTQAFVDPLERDFDAVSTSQAIVEEPEPDLIRRSFPPDNQRTISFLSAKLWSTSHARSYREARSIEQDALVARRLLAAMPETVQEDLLARVPEDPFKKARLLEAAGEFSTQRALQVLIEALNDTRDSGLPLILSDGWSLRVCDIAYNTLVHRLRPEGLRAPLGVGMHLTSRDRWISRLREELHVQ